MTNAHKSQISAFTKAWGAIHQSRFALHKTTVEVEAGITSIIEQRICMPGANERYRDELFAVIGLDEEDVKSHTSLFPSSDAIPTQSNLSCDFDSWHQKASQLIDLRAKHQSSMAQCQHVWEAQVSVFRTEGAKYGVGSTVPHIANLYSLNESGEARYVRSCLADPMTIAHDRHIGAYNALIYAIHHWDGMTNDEQIRILEWILASVLSKLHPSVRKGLFGFGYSSDRDEANRDLLLATYQSLDKLKHRVETDTGELPQLLDIPIQDRWSAPEWDIYLQQVFIPIINGVLENFFQDLARSLNKIRQQRDRQKQRQVSETGNTISLEDAELPGVEEIPDNFDLVEMVSSHIEFQQELKEKLQLLTPREQEAFLHRLGGLAQSEGAALMKLRVDEYKDCLQSALARLKGKKKPCQKYLMEQKHNEQKKVKPKPK
jgi:hypothetical protein